MISQMNSLKMLFPALKLCVISVFIKNDRITPFNVEVLNLHNRTSFTKHESLRISLLKLISAFDTKGPGARKLIRLCHEAGITGELAYYGPLVDVTSITAILPEEASDALNTTPAEVGSTVAEKVLEKAFCHHRRGRKR